MARLKNHTTVAIILCAIAANAIHADGELEPRAYPVDTTKRFRGVDFNHVEYNRLPFAAGSEGPGRFKPLRLQNATRRWIDHGPLLSGFYSMYNADVLYDPARAYPFTMYFFGWAAGVCNPGFPGCDAVFLARGKSLFVWEVYSGREDGVARYDSTLDPTRWQPVLLSGNSFYDQWHLGDPSVVKVGDLYFMAYSVTGFDADGLNPHSDVPEQGASDRDGFYMTIGGAYSEDGVHWKKLPRPLLSTPVELGAVDPPMHGMFHRPSLMYDAGRFKLWFDYRFSDAPLAAGLAMGLAELEGPPTIETFARGQWTVVQGRDSPAIVSWPNPEVIKTERGYFAYSDPKGFGRSKWIERKVVEAFSKDGYRWRVTGYLEPDQGCAASHVPEALYFDARIYLITGCMPGDADRDDIEAARFTSIRVKSRRLASE